MFKKVTNKLCFGFVLVFLYIPILVVIVFAFNKTKSRTVFSGFTFNWFFELFKDRTIMEAFLNSLILAITSSIIATLIGLMASLKIVKFKKRINSLILNLNYIPIINPDIVTGVSLMMVLTALTNFFSGQFGFLTALCAHITISLPYTVLLIIPKVKQIDLDLLNAAIDLGCNLRVAFFKAILPQIMSGIVGSLVMAFSISFDDFTISYFTTGSNFQTLPVLIYSMVRRRVTPKINALFALIFILALLILALTNFLNSKSQKSKKQIGEQN